MINNPQMSYFFDGGDINGMAVITVRNVSPLMWSRAVVAVAHRFITDIIKEKGFDVPALDSSQARAEFLTLDNCWQVYFSFTKEASHVAA